MTPSPGTMRRSAAAISSRRAMTAASGKGMSIGGICHCERSEAISRRQIAARSRLPRRLTAPRNDSLCRGSALAGLEARVRLVDHVDAALAPDDAAVLVALLQCLQRIGDLHGARILAKRRNIGSAAGEVNA